MATMTATPAERVDRGKIWPVGLLAAVVAAVLNAAFAMVAARLVGVDPAFQALNGPGAVITFTLVGVLLATAVFWLLARASARPVSLFRTVAVAALLVSFVPNVLLLLAAPPGSGVTPGAITILMLTHVIAAVVAVGLLTTRTRAA